MIHQLLKLVSKTPASEEDTARAVTQEMLGEFVVSHEESERRTRDLSGQDDHIFALEEGPAARLNAAPKQAHDGEYGERLAVAIFGDESEISPQPISKLTAVECGTVLRSVTRSMWRSSTASTAVGILWMS